MPIRARWRSGSRMRGLVILAAALAASSPALAQVTVTPKEEAVATVDAFFAALRSEDRTALAGVLDPQGTIYVHNHMDAENPQVSVVKAADFLAGHLRRTTRVDEHMSYEHVLVSGDMALVWGPYTFWADGEITHCGINSMSLAKQDGNWRVGNASFTMEQPNLCPVLGAPMLVPGAAQ